MSTITYRPFTADDSPAVAELALTAWRATYRDIFAPDFIDEYVGKNYAPAQLAAAVPYMETGDMFFDVAFDQTRLVGFCHIGLAENAAVLYRIYLEPAYIGRGIGSHLLRLGQDFARLRGRQTLSCFVHSKNEIGKQFYLRQGFKHHPEHDQDYEWYLEKEL